MLGKSCLNVRVVDGDWNDSKPEVCNRPRHPVLIREGKVQLAEANFDSDFPNCRGTDKQFMSWIC